jgi:hypothetical protein
VVPADHLEGDRLIAPDVPDGVSPTDVPPLLCIVDNDVPKALRASEAPDMTWKSIEDAKPSAAKKSETFLINRVAFASSTIEAVSQCDKLLSFTGVRFQIVRPHGRAIEIVTPAAFSERAF